MAELDARLAGIVDALQALQDLASRTIPREREETDPHIKLSLNTPFIPCTRWHDEARLGQTSANAENGELRLAQRDGSGTISAALPQGAPVDDADRAQISFWHKKRGKRLTSLEKSLSFDQFINEDQTDAKHDAYKHHPVSSKDTLTDGDVLGVC